MCFLMQTDIDNFVHSPELGRAIQYRFFLVVCFDRLLFVFFGHIYIYMTLYIILIHNICIFIGNSDASSNLPSSFLRKHLRIGGLVGWIILLCQLCM